MSAILLAILLSRYYFIKMKEREKDQKFQKVLKFANLCGQFLVNFFDPIFDQKMVFSRPVYNSSFSPPIGVYTRYFLTLGAIMDFSRASRYNPRGL